MKRNTQIATLLGLGATLALGGIAGAQDAAPTGTINSQTVATDTVTETTGAVATDATASDAVAPDTLVQTGGEPLLMVVGGLILAGGALALRRKLA